MKTRNTLIILLVFITTLAWGQPTPGEFSKKLMDRFREMAATPVSNPDKDQFLCKAIPVFNKIPTASKAPALMDAFHLLKSYQDYAIKYVSTLDAPIEQGLFTTKEDKALNSLNTTTNFNDFVNSFTGEDVGLLSKDDNKRLRDLYNTHPLKVKRKHTESFTSRQGNCTVKGVASLMPLKWNYPQVTWELETTITLSCDCTGKTHTDLKHAYFVMKSEVDGLLTTTSANFEKLRKPISELRAVICCPTKQASVDLSDPTNVIDTESEWKLYEQIKKDIDRLGPQRGLPNQYIGATAGVGFEQDFEEVSVCIGAEYGYKLGQSPKGTGFYVGGEAHLGTTSFMDFSRTWIGVGPQVQAFTPISQFGDTQIVNEIEGLLLFGSQENNGVKDDITGFSIGLNTGVNIIISDKWSVGVEIPVLTHQSLTISPENGGEEFTVENTRLLINKNNPATVSFRFNLGD